MGKWLALSVLPVGNSLSQSRRLGVLASYALSVKACGFASSPKGRAKSTAGKFLFAPNTLALNFTAWLSLWESWRGSA